MRLVRAVPEYDERPSDAPIDESTFTECVMAVLRKKQKVTEGNRHQLAELSRNACSALNAAENANEHLGDAALALQEATNLTANQVAEIIFNASGRTCPYSKSWICRLIKDADLRRRHREYGSIKGVSRRLCLSSLVDARDFQRIFERMAISLDDFPDERRVEAASLFKKADVKGSFSIVDSPRPVLSRLCTMLTEKDNAVDHDREFVRSLRRAIIALRDLNQAACSARRLTDLSGTDQESSELLRLAHELQRHLPSRSG